MKNCNSIYPVAVLRIPMSKTWWMIISLRGFSQWKKRGMFFTAFLTENKNLMAFLSPPQREDFIRRYNKLSMYDQGRLRTVFALAWRIVLRRLPIIPIPENIVHYHHFNPRADLVFDHVHHMTYLAKRGTVSRNEEIGTVLANCADQIMKVTWYKKHRLPGKHGAENIKAVRFLDYGPQSVDSTSGKKQMAKEENIIASFPMDYIGREEIKPAAFAGANVSVVELPKGMKKIGREAFRDCSSLTEVILPDSIVEIDDYAFENCVNLRQIQIPDSVLRIGEGAFRGCCNLKTIHLPKQLFKVEEEVFSGCSALEEVNYPISLRKIGHSAFRDCARLKTVWIPHIEEIGEYSFRNCSSLIHVEIPEGVEKIEMGCFAGCTSLESLDFPSTLKAISFFAFKGCVKLQEITFLSDDVNINPNAFEGCCHLPESYHTVHCDGEEK